MRRRECVPPKYGGKSCEIIGNATDTRECNTKACPINQYHTMHACEGAVGTVTCKKGNGTIHILSADYGRWKHDVCSENKIPFWDYNCRGPWQAATKLVTSMCENKMECQVGASDNLFVDKCPLTYKFLEVMYQCYGGKYPELAEEEE